MPDFELFKDSGSAPMKGTGAKLPFFFKRLAAYAEACADNPPGIDFPNRHFAVMYLIFFGLIFISFALFYRFLIVIGLLVLIYGVIYGVFIVKIAKAARLSPVKTRLFTAAVFILGAAAGLAVRYLIFK